MTFNSVQKKILNKLLDKYEGSKSFLGENKVSQNFTMQIDKIFPAYGDDARYEEFAAINQSLKEMAELNLVTLEKKQSNVVKRVTLNQAKIQKCYQMLRRVSKEEDIQWLRECWQRVSWRVKQDENQNSKQKKVGCENQNERQIGNRGEEHICDQSEGQNRSWDEDEKMILNENTSLLETYISAQKERLKRNASVEYYDGNRSDYEDLLKLIIALEQNTKEQFIREFSVQLFGNSKRVESLRSKGISLLFQYGDFQEKEFVLEECGVVQTPTYVYVKGSGRLVFWTETGTETEAETEAEAETETETGGETETGSETETGTETETEIGAEIETETETETETIDLGTIVGDIGLSTVTLEGLSQVIVTGKRVITIENLTSFHDYNRGDDLVIYLGGFHNRVKGAFLRKIYESNPQKEYRHFGDIDAGGLYIFEHLRKKTGIPFEPIHMDVETLVANKENWLPLTDNDRRRLMKLQENDPARYGDLVKFMLGQGCKLEQEGIARENRQ